MTDGKFQAALNVSETLDLSDLKDISETFWVGTKADKNAFVAFLKKTPLPQNPDQTTLDWVRRVIHQAAAAERKIMDNGPELNSFLAV
jgi:hypothetical protein